MGIHKNVSQIIYLILEKSFNNHLYSKYRLDMNYIFIKYGIYIYTYIYICMYICIYLY